MAVELKVEGGKLKGEMPQFAGREKRKGAGFSPSALADLKLQTMNYPKRTGN
jgi:hypothetical protein